MSNGSKKIATIVAGPNGAGKTDFSPILQVTNVLLSPPINLDFLKASVESSRAYISHDIFRYENMVEKEVINELNARAKVACNSGMPFSYETNLISVFQAEPLSIFKRKGYSMELVYILVDNVEKCKIRVLDRVKNKKGHGVTVSDIEKRFLASLNFLDGHFEQFDKVYLFNNSSARKNFKLIAVIQDEDKKVQCFNKFPNKLIPHLPKLYSVLQPHF